MSFFISGIAFLILAAISYWSNTASLYRIDFWVIVIGICYFLINICQYLEGKPLIMAYGMGDKNKFYQFTYFLMSLVMFVVLVYAFINMLKM
jgi:uncharacterized membrane protein